jgi:hypothetical protein
MPKLLRFVLLMISTLFTLTAPSTAQERPKYTSAGRPVLVRVYYVCGPRGIPECGSFGLPRHRHHAGS